jgi:hypothetical protein
MGLANVTGNGNVAFGGLTLANLTSAIGNSGYGVLAGCALSTGNFNTLLGYATGCNLTTGCWNVAIGNSVQVASATGSCQLAIGTPTFNWLTGTSTGAIKPGAGIIDCANSCGTAGQVLMSNGSNAVCWGTAGGGGVPSWTNGGTVSSKVTGTVSNPSFGNAGFNTVYYRQLGAKEYEVVYIYNQSAPGSAGSGSYLFTLPAGLQFDTTLQFQFANTGAGPNALFWLFALPGPTLSHITDGSNSVMVAQPLVYDATRFRLIGTTGGTLTAPTTSAMGSSVFPFSTFGLGFVTRFQFTST